MAGILASKKKSATQVTSGSVLAKNKTQGTNNAQVSKPVKTEPAKPEKKGFLQTYIGNFLNGLKPLNVVNMPFQAIGAAIDKDKKTTPLTAAKENLKASNPFNKEKVSDNAYKGLSSVQRAVDEQLLGGKENVAYNYKSYAELPEKMKQTFRDRAKSTLSKDNKVFTTLPAALKKKEVKLTPQQIEAQAAKEFDFFKKTIAGRDTTTDIIGDTLTSKISSTVAKPIKTALKISTEPVEMANKSKPVLKNVTGDAYGQKVPVTKEIPMDTRAAQVTGDNAVSAKSYNVTPTGQVLKPDQKVPLLLTEGKPAQKTTGQSMIDIVREKVELPKVVKGKTEKPKQLLPGERKALNTDTTNEPVRNSYTVTGGELPNVKNSPQIGKPIKAETPKPVTSNPLKPVKEPIIPEGMKESGFNKNVRTDAAMNDELRDAVTENPSVYNVKGNPETLSKAQAKYSKGYDAALNEWRNTPKDSYKPEEVPLARMIANEAAKRGDMATARAVIADTAEKLTQAGQYSQAAKILRESDPGAFMDFMQRQVNKLNKDGLKMYGKKWNDIQLTDNELKTISQMATMDEDTKEHIMESIATRISKEIPVNNMEKFDAWRRMAMLLNPKTHIRNVGGNAIMMGMRKTADTIGAVIEKATLKPGQRTKSFLWSTNKDVVNLVDNTWSAEKKNLLGEGRWDIESLSFMNKEKPIFKNKVLETVNEFSKNALNAEDVPFLKRAYRDALGQYLNANKLKEVTDAAKEYAKRRAYEATFKQVNAVTEAIIKWKKIKGTGKLIEAAVPFSKTPVNIVQRAIEYSPAGLIKALYSKGTGKAASDVIEDLAKGLTGSALTGLGVLLSSIGWMRIDRKQSKNAEGLMEESGQQPFSVITPIGSYTFDWAQPFAMPMAMGASFVENLKDSDKVDLNAIAESIAAGGDTLFNMSMLKNVKDLLGGKYGSPTEGIMQLPASYLEQAFPTVFGQVARTVDTTKRSTYDPNKMKQFGKEFAAKVPVLSTTLEPKIDIWGNEQKQGNAAQQFISPGYAVSNPNDPVTKELLRLYKATKDTEFLPKVAPYKLTINGKDVTLEPKEITEFQRKMGKRNYEAVKRYLAMAKNTKDDIKIKVIAKIVDNNYKLTKNEYIFKKK